MPPAIKLLNENSRSCRRGSDIDHRSTCCHQTINFARHDRAKSRWLLRHKSYMALGQTYSKIPQANITLKRNISDAAFLAEFDQLSSRKTAACENKKKIWTIRQMLNHSANSRHIVRQPQVSRVENAQG